VVGAKVLKVEIEFVTPLIARVPKRLVKEYPYAFEPEQEFLKKYPHIDKLFRRLPDGSIDPNQFRNMIYTVLSKNMPDTEIINIHDVEVDALLGVESHLVQGTPVLVEILRPGSKIRATIIAKTKLGKGWETEVMMGAMRRKGYGRARVRIVE